MGHRVNTDLMSENKREESKMTVELCATVRRVVGGALRAVVGSQERLQEK